jgi:hypothetical protein
MKFLKLTDPSGAAVWIAGQWVTKVTVPTRGQFPVTAHAIIAMGANNQAVTQSPEEVIRLLEGMGGDGDDDAG